MIDLSPQPLRSPQNVVPTVGKMSLWARSDVEPLDPAIAVPVVRETVMLQYLQLVAVTLLVYDCGESIAAP